ncbi:NF-kappa-B inhibitor-like protein 1 [Platysternon megacephalum]|uniref:NF-kappa-B inhibitor-like protein 1 n=1 Tax=Platysternon megacephalum TaxID=55544 RepID=A0A4D9DL57_9SAUR|nr:NF-kappa-B inhibitor-like protein 1 [Platysternon megacephalum]
MTYFLKHREDLKVVMKITDDERLVSYVADRVQRLSGELQRYDTELVLYVLQNLQNELEDEENLSDQMKENITTLKKNIAQLLADSQT